MKGKSVFLAVNLSLVLLSLLTGLKILPGPDLGGIILAFYSLFILPGILINLLIFKAIEISIEAVARLFLSSLIFDCLLVSLGFIPGFDYPVIAAVGAGSLIILSLLHYLVGRKRAEKVNRDVVGRFRPESGFTGRGKKALLALLIVVFALCFTFFYGSGERRVDSDSLDHISFIRRSLDSGRVMPRDSFYQEGDGEVFDPRKGIWHPLVSWLTYQSDCPVEYCWSVLPALLAFFALIIFWFYARELLESSALTILASIFLILFMRGGGLLWFTKLTYSRNIVQLMAWATLGYWLRYLRNRDSWMVGMIFFLALIGSSIHPVYALLIGALWIGMLVVTHLPGEPHFPPAGFWTGSLAILAGLIIPVAVRMWFTGGTFNAIHTHRQAMMFLSGNLSVVDPVEIISQTGLGMLYAIVLSPFVFLLSPDRKKGVLTGTLFIVPVVTVLNPLWAPGLEKILGYLHYRILFAAPLMCLLSLVVSGLVRVIVRGSSRGPRSRTKSIPGMARRLVALLALALFILVPLRFSFSSLRHDLHDIRSPLDAPDRFGAVALKALLADIPERSVIFSDPQTSYLISAYTDHYVTVVLDQHGSPGDGEGLQRVRNARDLFCPAVPLSDNLSWLRKKGAEFVVLNTALEKESNFYGVAPRGLTPSLVDKFLSCSFFLTELKREGGFILLRLNWGFSAAAIDSECSRALSSPPLCVQFEENEILPGMDIGRGIFLEGLHLDRKVFQPGDTLTGWFCWSLPGGTDFGLPLWWILRMDTEFPRGTFFREWYGKQYRRQIQQRDYCFYRFTYSRRLLSGDAFPDQWPRQEIMKQYFTLPLSPFLSPGRYDIRIKVDQRSYLANRRLADFFLNQDSQQGEFVASIVIDPAAVPDKDGGGEEITGESPE
ncbi:MAG: hypothetical protein JXB45_09300 [Candidatus Krumholzibacteriota bacterium]|nr:hypothetical protein [Candidatus Krumholzibacteriota bacterium]